MKHVRSLIISMVFMLSFAVSPVLAENPFLELISGSKIYFSHIATSSGWETEISVLNPTIEQASGILTFYSTNGLQIGAGVSIDLPAHGRYQAEVGSTFAGAENIAYIVLTSEVSGLKGYSKFYTGTVRASIIASIPKSEGLFTKIDHEGWTGIAFINTASTATAQITLTAYDNAGKAVAVETMQVLPGAKVVKIAQELFTQSIAEATYISYLSDLGVVGFFLNGSADNTMLDGSQAL